ncbi:glycine zipper 2TM domain-containing protein [Undibacterium fentianense]|uniref:Glycine zipper 2TM domain-containing protein n=1 Tax=Undibacterium fentianense TaxID=2828728 RepID=A0A941DYV0_9BURK|nr:glycine zipper 2TM domain-containing protein [Undibacterium fentianense]MBR7799300.1 glycine zipper 2TM domain-containing protein [Undibacterium fentianense]
MRKFALIAIALIMTQLTGCVVHRYRSEPVRDYGTYNSQYSNQYPNQYSNQYADQYASQSNYQHDTYSSAYQQRPSDVAQIISIRQIGETRESSGGGAVVGAILGGIIGNQIGRDDGHSSYRGRGHAYRRGGSDNDGARAVATLGGAILGGVIGNEIDRGNSEQRSFTEITVRMANGQAQAILMASPGQFRVGDRVRVGYQGGKWMIF